MNSKNCTPNFIKLETTMVNGIINLGKYTFPNIPALALKTPETEVKQLEK